jgi:hypothetical protein
MKVFFAAFLCLQSGFGFFFQKNLSEKADLKMLVKLTTVVATATTATTYFRRFPGLASM